MRSKSTGIEVRCPDVQVNARASSQYTFEHITARLDVLYSRDADEATNAEIDYLLNVAARDFPARCIERL